MKKFMKAIAFATVMCMLLSTAAFAAATMNENSTVTVNVTGAATEAPIAFVVSTAGSAAAIDSANIKDVAQINTEADGSATITLGTGGEQSVNIFYGYQGVETAQMFTAVLDVEPGDSVDVNVAEILSADAIDKYTAVNGVEIPKTDNDRGSAIIATVDVNVDEGRVIKDMIWSIRYKETAEGELKFAYVKANASLFSVLDGEAQIGLAFSNGNKSGKASVIVDGLEAIVKTGVAETTTEDLTIFSDEAADKANGPQA